MYQMWEESQWDAQWSGIYCLVKRGENQEEKEEKGDEEKGKQRERNEQEEQKVKEEQEEGETGREGKKMNRKGKNRKEFSLDNSEGMEQSFDCNLRILK